MTTIYTLVAACVAMPAFADAEGSKYKLSPQLVTGQEIVYSGTMLETQSGTMGAVFKQPYELEVTALVTAMDAYRNAEMACYTLIKLPNYDNSAPRNPMEDAVTYHIDLMKISPTGQATWRSGAMKGKTAAPFADDMAPWEIGYFMEIPSEPVSVTTRWTIKREGQPPIECVVLGTEVVDGEPCVKVACQQMSPTWAVKNATMPAWKSEVVAWISAKRGLTYKMDRTYSMRKPGDAEPSHTIATQYTLVTNLVYSGPTLMERTTDAESASMAQDEWEKYIAGTLQKSPKAHLAALKHKLKFALEKPNASPYRLAMTEMLKTVEEAEKNAPAIRKPAPASVVYAASAIGRKARNVAIRDTEKNQMMTMKDFKGRMVALVYCDPESPLSRKALDSVMRSATSGKAEMDVYAVCPNVTKESMEMLKKQVFGNYKICKAQSMDRSYGMTVYPHTIVIDEDGMLRANFAGYGPELSTCVANEVAAAEKRMRDREVGSKSTDEGVKIQR